ncbi:MFS transporter [Rheinheimera marina]|uniref:MFS transporter n=1 Tax=Rheinheimera marina TaxID=1774958 RepID=A0ABV9JIK7_9GAMM
MSVEKNPLPSATGSEPAHWGAVNALAICSFVLVAAEFMPVSLLTPMAADLQLTEGQAGQSVSICSLAALFSSLSIRTLAGTLDRRTVLLCLTALLISSGPLVAFAPNFTVLMLGRVLLGLSLGGFWSLSAATAMRLVPAGSVAKALAVISGGTALAGTVAAPLGSVLGELIGWRGAFFCLIPVAVVACALQFRFLPQLPAVQRSTAVGVSGLLRRPAVAVGYFGAMLFFAGQFSLYTYLRPYLEQVTQAGVNLVSFSLLMVGIAGFVGTLTVSKLIGPRLHWTLTCLSLVMALMVAGLLLFGEGQLPVLLLLAVWGWCGTAAQVTWWAWVTRAAADDAEAGGGLLVAVAQVGIASGATLGGLAYDSFGPLAIPVGSSLTLVLAALVALSSGWLKQPGGINAAKACLSDKT